MDDFTIAQRMNQKAYCNIRGKVAEAFGWHHPADCFCNPNPNNTTSDDFILRFIDDAVNNALRATFPNLSI